MSAETLTPAFWLQATSTTRAWRHEERTGPPFVRLQEAIERARRMDWESTIGMDLIEPEDDFRTLMAGTLFIANRLATRQPGDSESNGELIELKSTWTGIPLTHRPEVERLVFTFAVVFDLAHRLPGSGSRPIVDKGEGDQTTHVGIVPVIWVAIGVAAVVGLYALIAPQVTSVIDRALERRAQANARETQQQEAARVLLSAHATTLELAKLHAQREAEAGASLPMDAPTREAFDALKTQQDGLVKVLTNPAPLPTPAPLPPPKDRGLLQGLVGDDATLVLALAAGWYLLR